jgi:crotonobetainyl-CoA:carnitine CoA-transferase CaiB-like acyl-CoA transferase
MFLGDWGAEVIKIEWWHRMDAWRGMISIEHDVDGQQAYNKKPNWLVLNRNKRGVTLNLKSEKGKELFLQLVKQSDVVADNFSARVMERLGLGYDVLSRLNPRIIMISLPGFGNDGPHASYVSNGATIEGYAGLASLTGYEDGIPRNSVGIWPDPAAGINGAVAVAMALVGRHRTGKGQYIELSQAEALTTLIGEAVLDYSVNGRVQSPVGNSDSVMAPHGCYPCRGEDAWVTIAVATDAEWQALCGVANHPKWLGDARFRNPSLRRQHRQALDECVQTWARDHDPGELADQLQQAGVAATPVLTQEDFKCQANLPSEGFYAYLDHAHVRRYPGAAARLDGRELPMRYPPPLLGEHNEEVYGTLLGLSADDLARLQEQGVI